MNKKISSFYLMLIFAFGAILMTGCGNKEETEGANESEVMEEENQQKEQEVIEEENDQVETEQEESDEIIYSDSFEDIQQKKLEAGKKIDLTEEEMIQTGKDLVTKYQSLWNVKSVEEFDIWYDETMLTEDFYDALKEYITYGDTELVSVDFEDEQVIPNSPFSYQWTGIITVKFKSFSENLLYTKKYNFSAQIATNDTVKEYRIFTVSPSTGTIDSKTEPL